MRRHFPEDTPANREALIAVTRLREGFIGAERRADGAQIWAQVREGRIMNGGVNAIPRRFSFVVNARSSVEGTDR